MRGLEWPGNLTAWILRFTGRVVSDGGMGDNSARAGGGDGMAEQIVDLMLVDFEGKQTAGIFVQHLYGYSLGKVDSMIHI